MSNKTLVDARSTVARLLGEDVDELDILDKLPSDTGSEDADPDDPCGEECAEVEIAHELKELAKEATDEKLAAKLGEIADRLLELHTEEDLEDEDKVKELEGDISDETKAGVGDDE
jgi:hypothetical protein